MPAPPPSAGLVSAADGGAPIPASLRPPSPKPAKRVSLLYDAEVEYIDVTFHEQVLGMKLALEGLSIVVEGFKRDDAGAMLEAERCGKIQPGDRIVAIEERSTAGADVAEVGRRVIDASRPLAVRLERKVNP